MRDALGGMLELAGYTAVVVGSANEALSYLATERPPRLILLDLGLPDIQGEAFYATIRTDAVFATVPVVVLTARADPPALPGVFATVCEGMEPEVLLGMVDAACRLDARRSSS
jgi:CheY-like chemotaxis protein